MPLSLMMRAVLMQQVTRPSIHAARCNLIADIVAFIRCWSVCAAQFGSPDAKRSNALQYHDDWACNQWNDDLA